MWIEDGGIKGYDERIGSIRTLVLEVLLFRRKAYNFGQGCLLIRFPVRIMGMKRRGKSRGLIIIPDGANVWPHELKTARALADAGHTVEFIAASRQHNVSTADVVMDGLTWEMKAPTGGRLSSVEKNLRRGSKQAANIIFDSRRMKHVPDRAIIGELSKLLQFIRKIKCIKFVNRHGEIIDIE